jgi:hypothetical protein
VSCDGKHFDCVEQSDCLECRVQLTPIYTIDAERVVVRTKSCAGYGKLSDEMLKERFQALLRHIDDHPAIKKRA